MLINVARFFLWKNGKMYQVRHYEENAEGLISDLYRTYITPIWIIIWGGEDGAIFIIKKRRLGLCVAEYKIRSQVLFLAGGVPSILIRPKLPHTSGQARGPIPEWSPP